MKKKFLIPVVLATVGLFTAIGKPMVAQTAKAETNNFSAQTLLKAAWNENAEAKYDNFVFGVYSGNVAKGDLAKMTKSNISEGNFDSRIPRAFIDWGGARMFSMLDERIVLSFTATTPINIATSVTSLEGGLQDSHARFFKGSEILKAVPLNGANPDDLSHTVDLAAGETFYFEWGFEWDGDWDRSFQFVNSGFSFTISDIAPIAREANYNVEHLYLNTIKNDGKFIEDTLVSYGMTFGNIKELQFVDPSVNKAENEEAYNTERGSGGRWWDIWTAGTNEGTNSVEGFAFTFNAKERVTINATHTGGIGWIDSSVYVSYLVRRGDDLRLVYEQSSFSNETFTSNKMVELVAGDTLYIYIWGSWAARNFHCDSIDSLKVNVSEILLSEEAKNISNAWVALRQSNPDFCKLDVEKQALLKDLISRYDALTAEEKEIVGRTYDTMVNTISETADYFRTYEPAGAFGTFQNNTYVVVMFVAMSLLLAGFGVILLRNFKKKNLN